MFNKDIFALARDNKNFRKEVVTGDKTQVVLMNIAEGGEIGEETHEDIDQTLVFVEGEGEAILDGKKSKVGANSLVFVPGGTKHNFVNIGKGELKLFTVYGPPEHEAGTVHKTKAEADAAEEEEHKEKESKKKSK